MCVVYLIGEFAVYVQIRFSPVLQITFRAGCWIWKHLTSRRLRRWVCEPGGMWPLASRSTFSMSVFPRENSLATLQQYRKDPVWSDSKVLLKQSKSRESHRLHRERWRQIIKEKQSLESFLFRNSLISLKYEVSGCKLVFALLKKQKMVYIFKQWEA